MYEGFAACHDVGDAKAGRGRCGRHGRQGAAILVRVMGIIETHSLPTLTRSYPRRFTFYVAAPVSSILASIAVEIVLTTLAVASWAPVSR
jgi:hypothetical protein